MLDDCQYSVESTIAEVGVMTIVVSSVENMFVQGWRLKGKELVRSLEGALKGKCRHLHEVIYVLTCLFAVGRTNFSTSVGEGEAIIT